MTATADVLEEYLESTADRRMASYEAFLRIPSVSALPEHAADCRRTAEFLADELRTMGVEHVEVAETGGHPLVYGDWLRPEGAPTVPVYGHYDFQPPAPLDEWCKAPLEPLV